jgi:hypothetical protein
MTVSSIQCDWGPNVRIVRIVTDSFLEEIVQPGWVATQAASIALANNGAFDWTANDVVLISYPANQTMPSGVQAKAFFYIFPDFNSVNPIAPIYPNLQGITANAGGGQSLAYPLNIGVNVVAVAATSGDSVILPLDVLGQTVVVANRGANPINIYPQPGDNINVLATNTPYSLTNGGNVMFVGVTSTSWSTIT